MGGGPMELDVEFVRAQFPAFSEPSLRDWSFFENAGGSYPCQFVLDRLTRFYRRTKVQPYGPYPAAEEAGGAMDEARRRLAAHLGVDSDEVSFGPSTTQNLYVLAQAFRQWMEPGDAVVVTNQDHEANIGPWRRLGAEGIEIREWRMDPETGALHLADLESLLDERVRLVCFPHASNLLGEPNPVAQVIAAVHRAGALACVDGVSFAPHGLPDVGELGADIYVFSTYKTYGPHQGVMVVRRSLGDVLPNQALYFNADTLYKRFTPAGPDHAQLAACGGVVDYVDLLADHHGVGDSEPRVRSSKIRDLIRRHEARLLQPLLDDLVHRDGVRLLGPVETERRLPTVAVAHERPGSELAAELAAHGIMAGGGHFYAHRTLEGLELDPDHGVLRLSFVHYTTADEVEHLIEALDQVL